MNKYTYLFLSNYGELKSGVFFGEKDKGVKDWELGEYTLQDKFYRFVRTLGRKTEQFMQVIIDESSDLPISFRSQQGILVIDKHA